MTGPLVVPFARLSEDGQAPAYAHDDDAGADLRASERVVLHPHHRAAIGTGLVLALPPGHAGFIHPRSGLAAKYGITVLNAPGTIDAGYRGEVKVILLNTDAFTTFLVEPGDRIAQLVIQRVERASFTEADPSQLTDTLRGGGGLGSTGRR